MVKVEYKFLHLIVNFWKNTEIFSNHMIYVWHNLHLSWFGGKIIFLFSQNINIKIFCRLTTRKCEMLLWKSKIFRFYTFQYIYTSYITYILYIQIRSAFYSVLRYLLWWSVRNKIINYHDKSSSQFVEKNIGVISTIYANSRC